jgi:hypothetical protein
VFDVTADSNVEPSIVPHFLDQLRSAASRSAHAGTAYTLSGGRSCDASDLGTRHAQRSRQPARARPDGKASLIELVGPTASP